MSELITAMPIDVAIETYFAKQAAQLLRGNI